MINPTGSKFSRSPGLLVLTLLICLVMACGNSETTGDDPGSNTTPIDQSSLTLSIPSSVVTLGTPVIASATLRDANGALLPNTVVTFSATSSLVTFTPASATALTNASGIAHITLNAASVDSAGATSITASAQITVNGSAKNITSAPVGIAVNSATVTVHSLNLGSPSISAYGTSSVSALIWVNGSPATVPIPVTFTSPCVNAGKATLTSPVTTIAGTATSTYKDNNCVSGSDVITASVTGSSANVTITVAIPATNNIQFVSATPAVIGIKGGTSTPTLPQSSLVKFKVVDSNNNGKADVLVDFSLLPETVPGNVTLSPASATSDSNGDVSTTLTSGTVPTPVWVVAKVHDTPTILSQSNTLTITTGLPTQNLFSLSYQPWNIEAYEVDGVESAITVIASDRLGNPVPNGTAVNFVSPESGQINPASCTTTGGTCTVKYVSSGTRPADSPASGRVTILAYAVGEKSFADANGNNTYDAGETFYDLGDLYVDYNENGTWDTNEQYFAPYASGGTQACPADGLSKENTCNATWGINYVRRSAVIVLSTHDSIISPTTVTMGTTCGKSFDFTVTDLNNNPMPSGTKIDTANNYIYYTPKDATATSRATASILYGTPIGNCTDVGGTSFTMRVDADCSAGIPDDYPSGQVDVFTETPQGKKFYWTISVNH